MDHGGAVVSLKILNAREGEGRYEDAPCSRLTRALGRRAARAGEDFSAKTW